MYSLNKIITTISLIAACAFVTLSPTMRAVDPPPNGDYPNGKTAEGDSALSVPDINVADRDPAFSAGSVDEAVISASANGKRNANKEQKRPVAGSSHFFGECDCGSEEELDKSLRLHSQHDYRMDRKFLETYYYLGHLPSRFSETTEKDISKYLSEVNNLAVLYYSYNERNNHFCAWLTTHRQEIVSHVTVIDKSRFTSLMPRLRRALGIFEETGGRIPRRRNEAPVSQEPEQLESLEAVVSELSILLFPDLIETALRKNDINSLIIVPITSFGTVPFSMLTIGKRPLVDFMSVSVAPALNAFKEPMPRTRKFSHPVVLGDPGYYKTSKWTFDNLPGARSEALAIASMLSTTALIGRDATFSNLKNRLAQRSDVSLIYLATHGIADFVNPLDDSFLLFADGLCSARKISKLDLTESHPLVVLSACQTGLGKDFDVGTIGLARAFYIAGASTVVMSLWSVNDESTEYMMTEFMKFAQERPLDIALRLAMERTREKYPDPVDWAGFSLYGTPTLN